MTAFDILNKLSSHVPITEDYFYDLIKDFQKSFVAEKNYAKRVHLHRNPPELIAEILQELYSYLMQIQYREEMRDRDIEKNSMGYVPTKIIDIWRADKRLKSLYNSTKHYCILRSKDFNIIAVHIAEYRAMNLLVRKIGRSLYKPQPVKKTEPERKKVSKASGQ